MGHTLTKQEQDNVRAALRVLRIRQRGLAVLASRTRMSVDGLSKAMWGMRSVSALMAIRVAQVIGVPIDDVLSGAFPGPNECRHCGHPCDDVDEETPDVQ